MKDRLISLRYEVFDKIDQLDKSDAHLLTLAREALDHSYSPYSNFQVGAAILLNNGQTLTGSNQENASYPLCLCAERVALAAADSQFPGVPVKAIAITARNKRQTVQQPVTPCGACRQVMAETAQKNQQDYPVIMQGEEGEIFKLKSTRALLPLSFDASVL